MIRPIVVLLIAFAGAAVARAADPCEAELSAMGGIPIRISASGIEPGLFDAVVRGIEREIAALETMMSAHTARGTVATINRQGMPAGPLPAALASVLRTSLDVSLATGGAFDVTVRPLLDIWKRATREGRLPTSDELAAARQRVGYEAIELDGDRVRIRHDGVGIDLGGVAKGYFGDVVVGRLRGAGATRCIVDVGADLVMWKDAAEDDFTVGVRNPWGEGLMGVLTVDGGAVVTSGDYERFVTIGDRRICHIVDPRTGEPVEGVHSVTVWAPTGVEADALATGIFVLGHDDGSALVDARPDIEAVIVADGPQPPGQQRLYVSAGLSERFALHDDVVAH